MCNGCKTKRHNREDASWGVGLLPGPHGPVHARIPATGTARGPGTSPGILRPDSRRICCLAEEAVPLEGPICYRLTLLCPTGICLCNAPRCGTGYAHGKCLGLPPAFSFLFEARAQERPSAMVGPLPTAVGGQAMAVGGN
uniref:Uncharacterized protein n=1 Tax=Eutreptiella gymnastica TaxID=73025 RepID=A0A7S4CWQ1_9EUGL